MEETGKTKDKRKLYVGITAAAAIIIAIALYLFSGSGAYRDYRWQKQLDLGQKYLAEQNYKQAVVAFTEAIEIEPKAEAYTGRAEAYAGMAEGMEELSTEWEETLMLAVSDYASAEGLYNEENGAVPAGIYMARAKIYIRLSDKDREYVPTAEKDLQDAISADGSAEEPYLLLMGIYEGNYDAESLEEILNLGLEQAADTTGLEQRKAALIEEGVLKPDEYTVLESFYNPDGAFFGAFSERYEYGKQVWVGVYDASMRLTDHVDYVYDEAGICTKYAVKARHSSSSNGNLIGLSLEFIEITGYTLDENANIIDEYYTGESKDNQWQGRKTSTYENGKTTTKTYYYDDMETVRSVTTYERDSKGRNVSYATEYYNEDGSRDSSRGRSRYFDRDEDTYTVKAIYRKAGGEPYVDTIRYYGGGWWNCQKEENYDENGNLEYYIVYDWEWDNTAETAEAGNTERYRAYYDKLTELSNEYGRSEIHMSGAYYYLDGLFFAKLMDFGGDGEESLFVAWSNDGGDLDDVSWPNVHYEIWEYDDGMLIKAAEPDAGAMVGDYYGTVFDIGNIDGKDFVMVSGQDCDEPAWDAFTNDEYYTQAACGYLTKTNGAYSAEHTYACFLKRNSDAGEGAYVIDGMVTETDSWDGPEPDKPYVINSQERIIKDGGFEPEEYSINNTTAALDGTFAYLEEYLGIVKTEPRAGKGNKLEDWQAAYLEFLESVDEEWKEGTNPLSSYTYAYCLMNIDGDGIPELYIAASSAYAHKTICSYSGGTLKTTDMGSGYIEFAPGDNLFVFTRDVDIDDVWEGCEEDIYTLENGGPELLHEAYYYISIERYAEMTWEEIFDPDYERYWYYWDGEQVSKEEYENLKEEALGGRALLTAGYGEDGIQEWYVYNDILDRIRYY